MRHREEGMVHHWGKKWFVDVTGVKCSYKWIVGWYKDFHLSTSHALVCQNEASECYLERKGVIKEIEKSI
jgi:phosphoribosyl-dephospho-CoA transferase